jgi:polyferredoxin/Pyruvate/2-oxoacid:ferredoxin oxidoreductase delta subunit
LRKFRISVQLGVLALFIFLVFVNSYPQAYSYPVDLFMRLDPYASIGALLAGRTLIVRLWPFVIVVASALVLGRVFCGYFCPLGTMLDCFRRTFRRKAGSRNIGHLRNVKYLVLLGTLAAAALGMSTTHFFDPVNIAERTGIMVIRQGISALISAVGYLVGSSGAMDTVLASTAFEGRTYSLSALFAFLFGVILLLELITRRFWCRYLCPLGALLSVLGSITPFARMVDSKCNLCMRCEPACVFGAIGPDPKKTLRGECTLCYRCSDVCPQDAVHFGRGRGSREKVSLGRRAVTASLGAGVIYGLTAGGGGGFLTGSDTVIRPPGALPEREFLATCTRCGACVGACLTGGLQHSLLEAGIEGIWTPILIGRAGGCEYECNLCGKVCNTQAIRYMPLEEKKEIKVGTAVVDRDLCIAWKEERLCYICDEICPAGAVDFISEGGATIEKPKVLPDKCTGCGLCEWKCPVSPPAIYVTPKDADRS